MTGGPVLAPVTAGQPRGTTQVVTRGKLIIELQIRGSETRSSEPKDNYTLRSGAVIGGIPERTKMPLPLGDYKYRRREFIWSVRFSRLAFYFDDDDDEESSIPVRDIISELPLCVAIIPEEPDDSLSMGDEHLSTIPKMKLDELIKSSVENLVPIPSESEDFSDIKNRCFDHFFSKIDSFREFSVETAHIDLIPPGINEANFDPEEDIRLVERLLYDNLSPRLPEEFNSENSDAIIDSFSPTPIPVEDSDSLMEEIDLFLTLDDSMPPGIENDNYDSEGDILFLEELLINDSPSLPENKSSNLDHFNDLSSPRPPPEPPDVEVFFDFEPDTGVLTTKVVKGIFIEVQSERLLSRDEFSISFIRDPLSLVFDTLLPFHPKTRTKYEVQRLQVQNKGSDGTGSVPGSIPDGSRMVTCHLAIGGSGL
ncbi:hypothetical protein Tco_0111649 [Tanacetum coccineum]